MSVHIIFKPIVSTNDLINNNTWQWKSLKFTKKNDFRQFLHANRDVCIYMHYITFFFMIN